MRIPFFQSCYDEKEIAYVQKALLCGVDYSEEVKKRLSDEYGPRLFLTSSASAAFELLFAALAWERGGEVILPSFTYPSVANTLLRFGLTPVFAEIDENTKALDIEHALSLISPRTRAVIPTHYGAASADLNELKKNLGSVLLIEDAALAFGGQYRGKSLGTLGDMGVVSFHRTKNVSAVEGGMLILGEEHAELGDMMQTIYDNGTDRAAFLKGTVSAYTWQAAGMNVGMPVSHAAVLLAQLEKAREIQEKHEALYARYLDNLAGASKQYGFALPYIPDYNGNNFELFYILLPDEAARERVRIHLQDAGIGTAFHYMPLHASLMGQRLGYKPGDLPVTQSVSALLLRLPLFAGMTMAQCDAVSAAVLEAVCS